GRPDPEGFLHVRERSSGYEEVCWDITVIGADGRVAAEMEGVRLSRAHIQNTTRAERYHVELRAAPRPGDPAHSWPGADSATILAGASDRLSEVRSAWRELSYPSYKARLEATFARTLAAALRTLVCNPSDGEKGEQPELTVEELVGVCREEHLRAVVRAALPLMEREGVLERRGGQRVRLVVPVGDKAGLRELAEEGAAFPAQTALAVRVGQRMRELLGGEVAAAEVAGAGGAGDLLEQYHEVGPASVCANRLLRALVEEVVGGWPGDRPLRVLEVGAGTGGTTVTLLPVLPGDRVRYTVTEVAEPVLGRLRQRLSGVDAVEFGLLDLDGDPVGQGFPR